MANTSLALILALTCISIFMPGIHSKPVKRSATDCSGTDCIIPQHELDFNSNPRDTELLENITGAVTHAFPEFTDLLMNIAHIHQNTTVAELPAIVKTLEEDKNLQVLQNLLIENVTAVITPVLSEMIRLMENQQGMQDRLYQLMQDQADRQSRLLENVTVSLQQSFLPLLTNIARIQQDQELMRNCVSGFTSGQHKILPQNTVLGSFPVVCDMDTDGGRWIVFQRRFDGSVDFRQVWDEYKNGFGSMSGEFWMGLNKLHVITSCGRWELRVDLEDYHGNTSYAVYDHFHIGDSASYYRLNIGTYYGTAGNGMSSSGRYGVNGTAFTTNDQDHDKNDPANCAVYHKGGWWYNRCTRANLNGLYLGPNETNTITKASKGTFWFPWKQNWQALKKTELKIRLLQNE